MQPSIAIASGKGGTGKTTLAVHLAAWLAAQGQPVHYLDCDVEEPNGHLFLQPDLTTTEDVNIPVPVVDNERCTRCGQCAAVCEFQAIAMLQKPLVFPELCHGCGGCTLVCPVAAIHEEPRHIGVVASGRRGGSEFTQGRLNVGEPLAPPVIRAVQARRVPGTIALLDAPPGTACPAVTTARGADIIVLVTEPTPFGLHDLTLAVATFRPLQRPLGVVVNRADADHRVQEYCAATGLPILAEWPTERRVAELYARGELFFTALPHWRDRFANLWERIGALQ